MWYHGKIDHEKSENILRNEFYKNDYKKGVFLVRDCSTSNFKYVLATFENGNLRNFPIEQHGKDAIFSFINGKSVHGLDELIRICLESDDKHLKTNLKSFVFVGCQYPPLKDCKYGMTTYLHNAVMNHSLSQTSRLLSTKHLPTNFCIDDKDEKGKTALHFACSYKEIDLEIPKLLIEKNASLFLRDVQGKIPFFYAIENDLLEIVKLMIDKDRDVIQMKDIETLEVPLHAAARLGKFEVVKILLDNNASLYPVNIDGRSPIELAAHNNHAEIVKFLQFRRGKSIKHAWSHGRISRETAASLLIEKRNELRKQNITESEIAGLFLLRFSENINKNVITMLKSDDIKNYEISCTEDHFHLIGGHMHLTVDELISHHSEFTDGLPAKLTIPLKPSPDDLNGSSLQYDVYSEIPFKSGGTYDWLKKSTPVPKDPIVDDLYVNEKYLSISNELLGKGNFGTVHKGLLAIPGKVLHVAVKTLTGTNEENFQKNFCSFLREAGIMMHFNNPFIVRMIGVVKGLEMKIVQELQLLGSLKNYLEKYGNQIVPADINTWAAQIAHGMSYLETKKFVHRDLAARNILLASKTHAKISDFGLSRTTSVEDGTYKMELESLPFRWYAPECFLGTYSHASDVWSFGVTIWEIYSTGLQPYFELESFFDIMNFIHQDGKLNKPKYCPEKIYDELLQCWNLDYKKRPNFDELTKFFKEYSPIYANDEYLVPDDYESIWMFRK